MFLLPLMFRSAVATFLICWASCTAAHLMQLQEINMKSTPSLNRSQMRPAVDETNMDTKLYTYLTFQHT